MSAVNTRHFSSLTLEGQLSSLAEEIYARRPVLAPTYQFLQFLGVLVFTTLSVKVPLRAGSAPFVIEKSVSLRVETAVKRWCMLFGLCAAVATAASCHKASPVQAETIADWREFEGTWTATGSRDVMHLLGERLATTSNFNGSLLLTGASRPTVGFQVDAIIFNDTTTGMVGRAVWTDEHGDRAFSALRGEGTAADNKIVGTFIGGTGRYAGAAGGYEFSWRFVMQGEDGTIQGQSIGLQGRVRFDRSQPISGTSGT